MSQRSKVAALLHGYFKEKGAILTPREYKLQKDTPVRPDQVRKIFGNWSRMEKIVRALDARNKNRIEHNDAREMVAEINRQAAEHEATIRAVGEDVDQKTAREEAARRQVEQDALEAATPEGARAVKVRKGGPESVDAKTIKESVANLVAQEHALLARTPQGAAESKELLGGVEDQDKANQATARENARTERTALLAATPEGAAVAKMEMDDTDGQLTREAEVRIHNELRLDVDPATDEKVEALATEELKKVRPDLAEAIERVKDKDEIPLTAAPAIRAQIAINEAGGAPLEVKGDLNKAPPADREPEIVAENAIEFDEPEKKEEEEEKAPLTAASLSPNAAENKDSVNLKQNKENPEAPPADRNPDPAVLTAPAEKKDAPKKK